MTDLIRNSDTQSVSVYYRGDKGFDNATASASHLDDHWWVDRVFVYPSLRGKGLGKRLVNEMLSLIRERGGGLVRVCPGGYNLTYEEQRTFYESCGFAETDPGTMELTV